MRHRRKLGRRTDYQAGNLHGLVDAVRNADPACVGTCRNDPTHMLTRPSDDIERPFCDSCLDDLQERGVFPEATIEKITDE